MESIAALAKVDIVKQRMEAAYETLQVFKEIGVLFGEFDYYQLLILLFCVLLI